MFSIALMDIAATIRRDGPTRHVLAVHPAPCIEPRKLLLVNTGYC